MLDLASVAAYFLFAFGFGLLWYRTLRRPQGDQLRMLGFPVLGIAGSDLGLPGDLAAGPEIMGVHIAIACLASFAAVYLDLALRERSLFWRTKRQPSPR
jgi:hypothetical protein